MSSNLTVRGLKLKNSPQFHFRFDGCHDVIIDSLYIKAPAQSPNTDGIHIEKTNDVKIYNSIVANGNSSGSSNFFAYINFPFTIQAYCALFANLLCRRWLCINRSWLFQCWYKEHYMWSKPWNKVHSLNNSESPFYSESIKILPFDSIKKKTALLKPKRTQQLRKVGE